MKKWPKKVWLSLLSVVIAVMSISAIPASAEVSRVIYFSIQSNTLCGINLSATDHQYYTQFSLSVNNISQYGNQITINLYKKDGTQLTTPGGSGNGFASDFVPGSLVNISPYSTVQYTIAFSSGSSCDDRPTFGKITVHSNAGLMMASGEVFVNKRITDTSSTPRENKFAYGGSTILINNGQPF